MNVSPQNLLNSCFRTVLVSFLHRRHKDVIHFKIYNNGECFNIYGEDEFASVPELIQFYRSGEGDFLDDNREPVDLIQPLHVQTSAAPLQQERLVCYCVFEIFSSPKS